MAPVRRPKKLSAEALWTYALRALGDRAHSAAELRKKLLRKAESSSDVTSVMAKLLEYGLTDDKKFSDNFASSRLANEGFGKYRVLRDLRAKQVASPVAEKAVLEVFAGTDEQLLAEKFLLRKYRGRDLRTFLQEEKNLASAYRRLRTGGFSSQIALSVLKKHSARAQDWEEMDDADDQNLT